MIEKIKTIIVDNEPPALEDLKYELCKHKEIDIVGDANSVKSGFDIIRKNHPDLVFIDIIMEERDSGIKLARKIQEEFYDYSPLIVFKTAYDNHNIVNLINARPIGYINTPVSPSDIEYLINAAKAEIKNKEILSAAIAQFLEKYAIAVDKDTHVINPKEDILYIKTIKTQSNKIEVHLENGKILVTRKKLKDFSKILQHLNILQTHTSYLVNLNKIETIKPLGSKHQIILKGINDNIPLSKIYRNNIMGKLGLDIDI